MEKKLFANALIEAIGSEIEDTFILSEYKSSSKASSADVVFTDSTGSVSGVIWGDNMKDEYSYFKGCLVKVTAKVEMRDGVPRLNVSKLTQAEELDTENIKLFTESLSDEQITKLKATINAFIERINSPFLSKLCHSVLTDEALDDMALIPGGITYHHVYNGGLLVHICEVVYYAHNSMCIQERFKGFAPKTYEIDRSLVYAGALLSDIGKLKVYQPLPIRKKGDVAELSNYISEGLEMISNAKAKLGKLSEAEEKQYLELKHIVSTAHASKHASCPRTKEAIIVNYADAASAGINAVDTSLALHERKGCQGNDVESAFFGYKLFAK